MNTDTSTVTISGKIEKIIFESSESAYLVAVVGNGRNSYTVCGVMPNAQEGERVELTGNWTKHPIHGNQFVFKNYFVPLPQTEKEIKGFLECLKGIGTATAEKIVEVFGEDTLEIIENNSDSLLSVSGITERKLEDILTSYYEKCGMQRLISFFHKIDISTAYASKIHAKYGVGAVNIVKNNPYILSAEIRGMGFASADKISLALGIPQDSPFRTEAALIHILKKAEKDGHCFLSKSELCCTAQELLDLPSYSPKPETVINLIDYLSQEEIEISKRFVQDGGVYPATVYDAEVGMAQKIISMIGGCDTDEDFLEEWIFEYEANGGMFLSDGQKEVVRCAAVNRITVVTGGAGVGKSTAMDAVVKFWHNCNFEIIAVAPTGKAAQRIKEVSGIKALTIHRFLSLRNSSYSNWNSTNDEEIPVEPDAFLIDEFSMVDINLASELFRSIPAHSVVVIIGDANQLPAIGPGNVLKDIIASNVVPVVELTEVFRQAKHSKIIQASQAIVRGEFPVLDVFDRGSMSVIDPNAEAVWMPCESNQIKSTIQWLLEKGLPHCKKEDIQLLSPVHKTECGNIALNKLAQEIWNPYRGQTKMLHLRTGDRVIQTANDYNRQVFNGDIGTVERIDKENNCLFVRFSDLDSRWRSVKYDYSDLQDLMLAYSISIHKSQGSEFPVVIIPVTLQHFTMLQRNILYTGFTRGKQLVILVGEKRAIDIALKNQKDDQRNTNLVKRLSCDSHEENQNIETCQISKVKCVHCGGECQLSYTVYSNWCDKCFLNPPLGHRFREATPNDIAQMLKSQEKSKASLAAKKANKKAFTAANDTTGKQQRVSKKRTTIASNNNSSNEDDLIFNYQD